MLKLNPNRSKINHKLRYKQQKLNITNLSLQLKKTIRSTGKKKRQVVR